MTKDDVLADIAKRNAGRPCLTIWRNGEFVLHGERDAEIATRSGPEDVLVNIDAETMDAVTFPCLQSRARLYEKILKDPARKGSPVIGPSHHSGEGE